MNHLPDKILRAVLAPTETVLFIPLLLLNILSALAFSVYYHGLSSIFHMCCLGALLAYVEATVVRVLPGKTAPIAAGIFFIVITNVLIIGDYFCIIEFRKPINQDVIDIILETHAEEASQFASTYFSTKSLLLIAALAAANALFIFAGRWSAIRRPIAYISIGLATIGMCLAGYCATMFAVYHNGMGFPQYTAPTRIAYSLYIASSIKENNRRLTLMLSNVQASKSETSLPTLVLIIGESHNTHHSQLYGYDKDTQPRLTHRAGNGELAIFSDVISGSDHTATAMYSIFSVDDTKNLGDVPIFPMIFKKAGYSVGLFDNQYLAGRGISFLADKELSDSLYDIRNSSALTDGDLAEMVIDDINCETHRLYIIHLMGQHYTYSARYPVGFEAFMPDDYPGYEPGQAKVLAAYDNAVLYGDYVVDRIINAFSDCNSAIIYISDHGEEIYDIDGFYGHGNAHTRADKSYQLHIPMFIWLSDSFRDSHTHIADAIYHSVDRPMHQRDISQLLLDIAEIDSPWRMADRSVINDDYDLNRQRIVLNSINYDTSL